MKVNGKSSIIALGQALAVEPANTLRLIFCVGIYVQRFPLLDYLGKYRLSRRSVGTLRNQALECLEET